VTVGIVVVGFVLLCDVMMVFVLYTLPAFSMVRQVSLEAFDFTDDFGRIERLYLRLRLVVLIDFLPRPVIP
jgi:predicted Kef-type K+ transport protein